MNTERNTNSLRERKDLKDMDVNDRKKVPYRIQCEDEGRIFVAQNRVQ